MREFKNLKIAVAGTGYVGLSIATLLSQHHKVTAVDIIPEKVELINNKKSPIQDEYIEKYLAEKELDLTATLDAKEAYSDADFVVIAAPTNYDSKKNFFDTSAVEAVIKLVIEYNPEAIMVIKSTIPVGYTASVREKFHCDNIIFSPEFLREKLVNWYKEKGLKKKDYYLVVGRFVPENSFEVMIREFMKSKSKKDFAIITNVNEKFLNELEEKLHFKSDKRIKFVGTVYDQELLKKIRENAYAYFHGHMVGGTNPSLIEALGSTDLNLLVDVAFNKEVAEDCALYWSRKPGSLAKLIDKADQMSTDEIAEMGQRAKKRVAEEYTWDKICGQYESVFVK